ncbi:uncharacterized protein LOC141691559 [Apium graveolens]|uniref:uncharacterized protein LOC141691559 n=1 Tax=Apium graveolens TaxID=4045 RepID=UPI003D7904BA
MDRADRPPDSWDPLSNSLVGTSSIRPERTGRALYGSAADYPATNNRSELTKGRVVQMYDDYSIPRGLCWLYAPREGERIYDTPGVPDGYEGCAVGISKAAFKCGLRVPPSKLIKHLFFQMGIAIGQMDPNGVGDHVGLAGCKLRTASHAELNLGGEGKLHDVGGRQCEEAGFVPAPVFAFSCYAFDYIYAWTDWFSLLISVSSREALIERKKARAAEKWAAEEAAKKAADKGATPDPSEGTGERTQTEKPSSPRQSRVASEAEEGDDLEYMGEGNPSKRTRSKEGIMRSYLPGWGVLTSDHTVYPARQSTKEVASDLCHGLQLPVDHPTFASASATEACTELLSFLSLAAPWVVVVEDKVKDMETRMVEVKELERRATAVEEELVRVKAQNEVEAAELKKDRSRLETELERANRRISHRNVHLKRSRKELRKKQKQLNRTEERCFQFGADYVLEKAHGLNWDYNQLMDDSLEDPIGRPAVEVPPVSSGKDEELSDEDPQA